MTSDSAGFLVKLLLISGAISAAIKLGGPLLPFTESDGLALAIVLSLPVAMGLLLWLRWLGRR
jgi:hypothetical protein